MKKLVAALLGLVILGFVSVALLVLYVSSTLPQIKSISDYKPLLVSEVYDRKGDKIGEFFRERRLIVPYSEIPRKLVLAFVAAEDGKFFEHNGINYTAMLRAFLVNLKEGRKVQGGSTITQQTAKTLFLSNEKTIIRKIKDVLLAFRLEENLSKEDILYLYLNQISFGHGAWGVEAASQIYYQKHVKDLSLAEMAILAGLPQAPSRYTPVYEPKRAKDRQTYVLGRMLEMGYITKEEHDITIKQPVTVFLRKDYKDVAPYFMETLRQYLVNAIGEDQVLDKGIKIYTTIDKEKQIAAQKQVQEGLRAVDKRQGYRGALKNLSDPAEITKFLLKSHDALLSEATPQRTIFPDGSSELKGPNRVSKSTNDKANDKTAAPAAPDVLSSETLPSYIAIDKILDGVVTKIDDKWGLVYVRFADSQGLIDIESMKWARQPNPEVSFKVSEISKPSVALKVGDVIQVRAMGKKFFSTRLAKVLGEMKTKLKQANKKAEFKTPEDLPDFDKFARLELEQEPLIQGALLSFDLETKEMISMVGGYDFEKSQLNRSYQATRQTGSSFKPIVYSAAMDQGFKPNTTIIDAPVVYEEQDQSSDKEGQGDIEKIKAYKPGNFGSEFTGDILFRNAIIQSKNIPTLKIEEKIGVETVASYARRLDIFSPLNMDLTLALGSSGITLYEMTKAFSSFALLGKKLHPMFIKLVQTREGEKLIENVTFDQRFENELKDLESKFEVMRQAALTASPATGKTVLTSEKPDSGFPGIGYEKLKSLPIFFADKEQVMSPQTAYLMTSLLHGVIFEKGGTGGAARALGREAAGKTGTTNGYYDAWFIGYTPQIATGVWVGFDREQTIGLGETGGRAALPIWLEYMKEAHKDLPKKNFTVPDKIVFVSIDNETGKVASSKSKDLVKQAFLDGTEPTVSNDETASPTEQDQEEKSFFYKQDLNE